MGSEVDAPVTRAFVSWDPGQWRGEAAAIGVDSGGAGGHCGRRPVMRRGQGAATAGSGGAAR